MITIKQQRLLSLKKYSPLIKGRKLIVCIDIAKHEAEAKKIGFSNLGQYETVLPTIVSTATTFNAEGKEIKRKDLPMETHYRQAEWTWEQWCGRGMTETHSKIVDIPYKKYPRDFIDPPSIQLKIFNGKIISPVFSFPNNEEEIKHVINIFLEVFGECGLLDDKLGEFIKIPTRSLNWLILPKGPLP